MKLRNILQPYLRWNNTEYTLSLNEFKGYCIYLGYNQSNFIKDVKLALNRMMLASEIEYFSIGERNLVISK